MLLRGDPLRDPLFREEDMDEDLLFLFVPRGDVVGLVLVLVVFEEVVVVVVSWVDSFFCNKFHVFFL